MIEIFFKLLCGHAFADFVLQTDFMAKNKARVSGEMWPYVLAAHSLIHGYFVFHITGNVNLGIAETLAHGAIDFLKCERVFGMQIDQALHIVCKIVWLCVIIK